MTLLDVQDLSVVFSTRQGDVRAVRDVSLSLERGERLGVVGESGSGKSVLVRTLMGLRWAPNIKETRGSVRFDGVELLGADHSKLRKIWRSHIGIVFQSPQSSLNPVMPIGRQISESLMDVRSRQRGRTQALELLQSVGIPDPVRVVRSYPHQLSGGMQQRVMLAIALASEPDLLIADEPTTALDVTVQAQILALLRELCDQRGMSLILVSHDLGVVAATAESIAVMYAGRIVEHGTCADLLEAPRMPYTAALLASIPRLDAPASTRLQAISGRPPDPTMAIGGCSFHPRCEFASDRCREERPPLESDPASSRRRFACWHPIGLDIGGHPVRSIDSGAT